MLLLWLLGLLASLALLGTVTRSLGQQHLRGDAETTALRYAHVVEATVPALDSLLAGAPVQGETLAQLREWVGQARYLAGVWERAGRAEAASPEAWGEALARELVASGAARQVGERITPA